jgi:hypothetical protein
MAMLLLAWGLGGRATGRRITTLAMGPAHVMLIPVKPSVIVWDLETVPDLGEFAAANDLVGKPDADVRAALGNKFPKQSIGLALSTAGTRGARMRCLDGPLAPRIRGAPRSPVTRCVGSWVFLRARCPHECTKQTLAGLRPRGTGGPGRGYERCRVARPEHLNPWWAGRTSRRSLAVGTLMTNSTLVDRTTGKSAGLAPLRMRPV